MIFPIASSPGQTITDAVNEVAKSLRYPVLILALLAGAIVIYELGRLAVEAWKRSQRTKGKFDDTARHAYALAHSGDGNGAQATLRAYAYGDALQKAAVGTLFAQNPIDAQRAVIEYDLYVSKRLDRVRLLVRAGPALGLMGTLIPLAPALAALGKGQPQVLADELQTAFAITVVGVGVGLTAFTVALVRERFYTKDLSDLEFLREIRGDAAVLTPATVPQPAAAAPAHQGAADQPAAAAEIVAPDAQPAAAQPAAAPVAAAPATPAPAAAVPTAAPAAGETTKKKFGLKKKTPKAAPAPAFPPPPPPAAPGVVDKTSAIPDAPAPAPGDNDDTAGE